MSQIDFPPTPWLEFSFYYGDRPEYIALRGLSEALVRLGAKFRRKVDTFRGPSARDAPFGFAYRDEIPLGFDSAQLQISFEKLDRIWLDPDSRIHTMYFTNAVGLTRNEVLTYSAMSQELAELDYHPLTIYSWADPVTGQDRRSAKETVQNRINTLKRFCDLVEITRPSYGAITIEVPMPCPVDLGLIGGSGAFYNFFVSEQYIGPKNITRLQDLFSDAFVKPVTGGIFVSTQEYFNPKGISIDVHQMRDRLRRVSAILANAKLTSRGRRSSRVM
jgi:hypothetical protein